MAYHFQYRPLLGVPTQKNQKKTSQTPDFHEGLGFFWYFLAFFDFGFLEIHDFLRKYSMEM
jgi:hypothetical protein